LGIPWGSNGNIRNEKPFDCKESKKYNWEIERINDKKNSKVIALRINGLDEFQDPNSNRYIPCKIVKELITNNKEARCAHCQSKENLVPDHKNYDYNDTRKLNTDDFQVLCNKCNKDIKHHVVHKKEKETNTIHFAKDHLNKNLLPIIPTKDNILPWEKAIRTRNSSSIDQNGKKININNPLDCCLIYSYWYDIDEFIRKLVIYTDIYRVNQEIKKEIKEIV
jgi:hypothetical protein